jgi:hypothetical protein
MRADCIHHPERKKEPLPMNAITGTWDLRMATPIGSIDATYVFSDDAAGPVGVATSRDESVEVSALTVEAKADGEHVTWDQRITRPLRLDLHFEVVVIGDQLTGSSRAGRLPRTRVTGTRRAA